MWKSFNDIENKDRAMIMGVCLFVAAFVGGAGILVSLDVGIIAAWAR